MSGELVPDRRELRASHEDRDQVVELLRVAAGDGRLTADELDQRLEVALTARTYGQLEALVADLPAAAPAFAVEAMAQPKELSRISVASASTKRDGPWLVPQRMEIECRSGTVTLDFTLAVITLPTLEIDCSVSSGSLLIVVPPDVVVDVDEVNVRTGAAVNKTSPSAGMPVRLRVHVSGQVNTGSILVRPPKARVARRTFWQWLLRRPRPTPLALPPGRSAY